MRKGAYSERHREGKARKCVVRPLTASKRAAHLSAMSMPPPKPDAKALKEAKLAQALRDNLRRRKASPRDQKPPPESAD